VAFGAEEIGEHLADVDLVVDDGDARHGSCPLGPGSAGA
jgi:hypothetical protein